MISYSVTMSLAIICILFTVGSIDYLTILDSQLSFPLFLTLLPITIILIITCVAELGVGLIKNLLKTKIIFLRGQLSWIKILLGKNKNFSRD